MQQDFGDAELVARLRAGHPAAFSALMRNNNQRLYRLARGFLVNETEAEDVVQESYVRAFTHLDDFRGGSSLATWLARIVVNEALGRLRKQRPTVAIDRMTGMLATQDRIAATADLSPEQAIGRQEVRRGIEKAVEELPASFRTVFMLRAVEQMTIEETASCLGIPGDTVKSRFHRAKKLLRRALTAHFGAFFDDVFPFLGARCDRLVATVLERIGIPFDAGSAAPQGDRPALSHPRPPHSPIARLQ